MSSLMARMNRCVWVLIKKKYKMIMWDDRDRKNVIG